jgi:septal ring factor EnvC (AmiA/AmiB activator)
MSAIRGEVDSASRLNEQKIRDELEKKQAALIKLWDSYELQERDISALKDRISFLEQELLQKDSIIANLRSHTESKDSRLRDTEIDLISMKRFKEESEPKIKNLEQQLRSADDRYAKVLKLWQATYESAKFWRKACEERDQWFDRHIGAFGDFKRAMDERDDMIARHRKEAASLEIDEAARRAALPQADAGAARSGRPGENK